ncbi:MAG TPA: DNA polymerase I [Solirubrobacterales bacterium]|nr:DNA polymerase I [Solirubrobacterales bacterium]
MPETAAKRKPGKAPAEAGQVEGELFLIDGNSLAYRAFFALPESIATADGRPTNAIYGFASMMAKILIEHRPTAVIVAWDAGMSGRELEYEPYKAQRRPRPDLLSEQWPHLAPLAEAFGFTNVKVDGWEADDVIAALVRRARDAQIPTMVVSGDRDVYQLVGDGVRVMTTSRGVTDTRVYDREGVVERYGVPPELVPDLIGLKGDTSDNIPGIPGIGDKTAAQLLQEFGSLEEVLANIDRVSGAKRKQNLTEHADEARISKQLATLKDDIEMPIDVREALREEPDLSRLREVAAEFELRAVMERLDEEWEAVVPDRAVTEQLEVEAVEGTPEDVAEGPAAVAIVGGRWAATSGDRIVAGDAEDLAGLAAGLREHPLIAHDAKSLGGPAGRGLLAVANDGELEIAYDTMVAAYLIDPARRVYELHELAADAGLAATPAGADPGQLSLEAEDGEAAGDPAVDARLTQELAVRQAERLRQFGVERLLREVEIPLIEVLVAIERAGVKLDSERLAEIGEGMAERIAQLEREIFDLAGREFTIGSPQQLGQVLFLELGLTKKRRGKTGFSTDARVLAQIRDEHEIVAKVESWRELTKLKNTYLDALPALIDPRTGRIHTTFNQVATTTGRLSSTNPNLQNIPIRSEIGRPVRSCFVAERGMRLLSADYNQVELRVLAHVAGEDVLREIFASGQDVHRETAAEVLQISPDEVGPAERSKAKMVNYGIAYGLSAFGLADRLQIARDEAALYIQRYFERFPAVQRFIQETIARAEREGFVTTLLGRRRNIPELRSDQRQRRSLGERLAVNTVIQGTAADIIKLAMVRCHAALREAGMATRLVLQIHDELLFEGPEAEMSAAGDLVRREMCAAFELDPPLAVDVGVGPDWLAAK